MHTKGPWHIENHSGDWGLPGVVYIKDSEGNDLAYADYRTPYCIGEKPSVIEAAKRAKANANLMSLAPELYEALKFIMAFYALDADRYLNNEAWKVAEASAIRLLEKVRNE